MSVMTHSHSQSLVAARPQRSPTMIALGILTTWLTLTAAGFAGLSALRRAGAREDAEAGLTPSGTRRRRSPTFTDPDPEGPAAMNPIVSERSRRTSWRPCCESSSASGRRPRHRASPMSDGPNRVAPTQLPPCRSCLPRREPSPRSRRVLLAGADERSRAMLRAEFGATLPPSHQVGGGRRRRRSARARGAQPHGDSRRRSRRRRRGVTDAHARSPPSRVAGDLRRGSRSRPSRGPAADRRPARSAPVPGRTGARARAGWATGSQRLALAPLSAIEQSGPPRPPVSCSNRLG